MTVIPRWPPAEQPAQPVAHHRVRLPDGLGGRVADLAGRLGVDERDVLLAAHLAVVGLLASDPEVTVGHGGGVVRARLPDGPWRGVVAAARSAAARPEPGVADTGFAADGVDPPAEALGVVFAGAGGSLSLRLRYRTDLFEAGYAVRVGGYLVRALEAMAADPDAPHETADLLSAEERQELVYGRAGRERPLPGRSLPDLFAAQAERTPAAPAVVHRGEVWSYERLDRAANRVAHALLAEGFAAEEVVAVATGRDPLWAAALIGVLRAGGAYLPVEPTLPAVRVATLLRQSGARLVLTGGGIDSGALLAGARDVRPLAIGALLAADHPDHAPGVAVGADRLAYIYFTSGSTGVPKGAMCEHLGVVNHLYAKIDDLGIGPDDVVVQNAQLSFDISLWQLVAPLVTGARVLIVERQAILDAARFVDTITGHGATILQVVPAYLDVLLRHLERHPRELGPLRYLSVTGEALSKVLATRWLAAYPHIPLVDAYGATELSDDTTHEILTEPPTEDPVTLGRPLGNVNAYVLGRHDRLLPTGSIGEIAFSGICVGRGYVNDPARTAQAFVEDPFRPGVRMYRTGDYGRWLPSGTLKFHGRRDEQVKIRGVRIEVGEVESRMLEHPGVGEAAVVVIPGAGSDKQLVGFYTAEAGLAAAELRAFLAAALPEPALPAGLHRLEALPRNANGKTDKKALLADAQARLVAGAGAAADAPQTPTEQRIALAWASALERPVESIRRDDHFFFDLGGSSLSALRVIAALDGVVSLDDLVREPVLRLLAAAADGAGPPAGGSLRLLAGPRQGAACALLCLPYAAGSAVNFQALAAAVARREPGIAVYALQAPGHDLGRRGEPLLGIVELAKLVVEEVLATIDGPVVLWGHCAGVALALEVARRLEDAGQPLRHVLLGGCLPAGPEQLAREIAVVVVTPDQQLAAGLAAQGGLEDLAPDDLTLVGRVYRHDTRTANQYLLDVDESWASRRLRCGVTVVVSTTDPSTREHRARFRDWGRFGASVELAEVDGGGHYFPRTRPDATAEIVVRACRR